MSSTIKIMLVDDHPMVQDGLCACLSYYEDIEVVAKTTDARQALDLAKQRQPDVILMDISMPSMNGLEATEVLLESLPDTKVLVFSMHESAEFVSSAMQVGASGYILKDTSSEEVYIGIKAVAQGKNYFSSSIAKVLMDAPTQKTKRLSTREQVVLGHIAEGKSSKEIAEILCISFRTVEAHRRNIKDKLNLDTFAELVRYAVAQGLVSKV